MNPIANLSCPIGLCNNVSYPSNAYDNKKRDDAPKAHNISCDFFDLLFNDIYVPMAMIPIVNNKTKKNRKKLIK